MAAYKLNEEAGKDLDGLYEHGIHSFGLDQADRYYDGLIARFCELAENPYLWQAVNYIRTGYRCSVYVGHSIYYRIDGDTVEIMRILGKQASEGSGRESRIPYCPYYRQRCRADFLSR